MSPRKLAYLLTLLALPLLSLTRTTLADPTGQPAPTATPTAPVLTDKALPMQAGMPQQLPTATPAPTATPLGGCQRKPGVDVVLVIDHSLSMESTESDGLTKLQHAQSAAKNFADRLSATTDQAALVALADHYETQLLSPLTSDMSALKAAIDTLQPAGMTYFVPALTLAGDELASAHHRATNRPVTILLSDGNLGDSDADVLSLTQQMKAAGVKIITIGLGDPNEGILIPMASASTDYYRSPSATDLDRIYQTIATALLCEPTQHPVYLPLLRNQPPGITIQGRVTYQGNAQGGVAIALYRTVGGTSTLIQVVRTAADGTYRFSGLPKLTNGQLYNVHYDQSLPGYETNDSRYLSYWHSFIITSTPGAVVEGGSFDIANIPLGGPAAGATLKVPVTFTWDVRPATRQDSYRVYLYDPNNRDTVWHTDLVGYAGTTSVDQPLPPGFAYDIPYRWYVGVEAPDYGFGASWTRAITLQAP